MNEEEQQESTYTKTIDQSSQEDQLKIIVVPITSEVSQHMELKNHEEQVLSPYV